MKKNKLLENPQDQNGNQGETRSSAILLKRFHVYKCSSDRQGVDLMVESKPKTVYELELSKKEFPVFGLVQAKYFQKGTTLRIHLDYVQDSEGPFTNFFALIHTTDDKDIDHWYFFKAADIIRELPLKRDKQDNLYYSFSVTKKRTLQQYLDIPHATINDTITEQIIKTSRFRYQNIISNADAKWIKHEAANKDFTREFHRSLEGLHIVDKLWHATRYYREFGQILAWRMVEKMSFRGKITDQTIYNKFNLKSTNEEITNFFGSITVTDVVKISKPAFFKGIEGAHAKVNEIIQNLNRSMIKSFSGKNDEKIPLSIKDSEECNCPMCLYESLSFKAAFEKSENISDINDHYDNLLSAHIFFLLGKYNLSQTRLENVITAAKVSGDLVPGYLALHNLEITQRYAHKDQTVDLHYELLKLPLESDKKQILKSISERSLLNDYRTEVDELYLSIKELKNRSLNYSTGPAIDRLHTKISECYFFYRNNRCFFTSEFETLFEKYVECCYISYSMQSEYRSHLIALDDFEITLMLLHCRPDKLLRFIQRNNLEHIKCSDGGKKYFKQCLENFLDEQNLAYLDEQIRYRQNRTENPALRQKIISVYTNVCYLFTFLEIEFEQKLLDKFIGLVATLDFSAYEISPLAFIILDKYESASNESLINFLKTIIHKQDEASYLPANILVSLEKKGFILYEEQLFLEISKNAIKYPETNLMSALWKVLDLPFKNRLKEIVGKELISNFHPSLYSESILLEILDQPLKFIDTYSNTIKQVLRRERYYFPDHNNYITGLPAYLHEQLDTFVQVYHKLGEKNFDYELSNEVSGLHPYFYFFINLSNYNPEELFEINWLTDDYSNRKLKMVMGNINACIAAKEKIKFSNNKELLKKITYHFL